MRLFQEGDSHAFEILYARHGGRVYGFLKAKLQITGNTPGEAEDLLQICFLKLLQHRESYDATLPFLPWLFSIARNSLIDHQRKRREVLAGNDYIEGAQAETREMTPENRWAGVLKLLPLQQRKLIEMRYQEGLSYEEIARRNDLSEVTARKRMSRVVAKLRKIVASGKGDES